MIMQSIDPAQLVYRKYILEHLLVLMEETLSQRERRLILMHCGMGEADFPMTFDELATAFNLGSSSAAESLFQLSIERLREAIPGSELENWIVNYKMVYRPTQAAKIHIRQQH